MPPRPCHLNVTPPSRLAQRPPPFVPARTCFGSFGSTATRRTSVFTMSGLAFHVAPPSVLRKTPPLAVPAKTFRGLAGSSASACTSPIQGPIGFQRLGTGVGAGAGAALAAAFGAAAPAAGFFGAVCARERLAVARRTRMPFGTGRVRVIVSLLCSRLVSACPGRFPRARGAPGLGRPRRDRSGGPR